MTAPGRRVLTVPEALLRRRTSMKWGHVDADVLPLWVAEMDTMLAEPIVRAVTGAIALGDSGYPHGRAYPEAFAAFAADRWGWTPDPALATTVPNVTAGITQVLRTVTHRGDAVIVNPPVYAPFHELIHDIARRVRTAPLGPGHRLDLGALDDAFRAATTAGRSAAYLLCSPHNPTGTTHTRAELAAVAELAARHRVRVIADEIHAPLTCPGAVHVPYLSLPGTDDAFAVTSASKAWNLVAFTAAVVLAGPAAATDLAQFPEALHEAASHLGVLAHRAALTEGRAWLDALLADLAHNRRLLGDLLAARLPAVTWRPPQATYLAWLDCRALGLGADPAAVFLDRGRVALSSGPDFGAGGDGHVRLNFATSPRLLTEAIDRLAAAVNDDRPRAASGPPSTRITSPAGNERCDMSH
ncbi:aminotransferase class I/II-fold pyridoxal phosphate-dependent enzyme [Actinoplanes sp. NBRC 103695]|uniref:MalY/PatB family protein n=1 Tax=Actinoplanes sp. NBRC 103695 TaxID=3032202 RepID=UPI0024A264B3|nr:aminotransferase class I/II-fold pyridoxal phosphate-dependent enzyme [Actinoplanes sp. NBRC 103695]GLY99621.1 cystathionine beta-lyase [Actinoplanes sp. NBRC 103695]